MYLGMGKKSPSKACRISKSWKLSSKIWSRARMKLGRYGGEERLGSVRGRENMIKTYCIKIFK